MPRNLADLGVTSHYHASDEMLGNASPPMLLLPGQPKPEIAASHRELCVPERSRRKEMFATSPPRQSCVDLGGRCHISPLAIGNTVSYVDSDLPNKWAVLADTSSAAEKGAKGPGSGVDECSGSCVRAW